MDNIMIKKIEVKHEPKSDCKDCNGTGFYPDGKLKSLACINCFNFNKQKTTILK